MENLIDHQKSFKEYYQDPAFKARHLEYMTTKVKCNYCNVDVSRCNRCKHERTRKHIVNQQLKSLKEHMIGAGLVEQVQAITGKI